MTEPNQPLPSSWIINTTAETFDQDVMAKSHEMPVVVDFWADWCAPCRMLAPVLESLAKEFDGQFVLVKANTEEVPEAAGKFQVQGIPAVFGVIDGEIVHFFNGALPEDQLRRWLEELLAANELASAKRLEEDAPQAAEAKYQSLIEKLPNDPAPKIGLARVLLQLERWDDCQAVIDELEERGFLEPEAEKLKARLGLGGKNDQDVASLRSRAANELEDFDAQLQLAQALASSHEYEEALQTCLTLVQRDRQGVGEAARQTMVDIFRVLPDDSELTSTYRRKLSMALY